MIAAPMTSVRQVKEALESEFKRVSFGWDIKGVIDSKKRVYTVTDDTKLISKIFELISFPLVTRVAKGLSLEMILSDRQTVYPDITLQEPGQETGRIAIDVKSTYRKPGGSAGFTLGSYTAYIRKPTKNIVFPYDTYASHLILGFIYSRNGGGLDPEIVDLRKIDEIPPAIRDVEIIVQEKWKVASDKPGSGNTANIGSVKDIDTLRTGKGVFLEYGEEVFLDYWRNYLTKSEASKLGVGQPFSNLEEFLAWRRSHPEEEIKIPEEDAERLALEGEAEDIPDS